LKSRDSGALHIYSLPEIQLHSIVKNALVLPAKTLSLSCNGKKLALISKHHVLRLYDLTDGDKAVKPMQGFERKEVWSVEWDAVIREWGS